MKIRTLVVVVVALATAGLSAAGLTPEEQKVLQAIDRHREAAIDLLAQSVDIASATENHDGVRKVGELYAAALRPLGFTTRWIDQAQVGRAGHLVAEHPGTRGTRVLLIGHLDTVLQGEAFRREGRLGYGSGSADMKSGDVIAIEALRALYEAGRLTDRQVIVVFTGDEEDTGKPYDVSRAALLDAAKRSDVAFAFEGYAPGTAVVGRRGFSSWHLEVTGSQGHSSTIFGEERGSGAIFEAARILSGFYGELREPYLTFNPSVVLGGTDVKYDAATFSGTAAGKTNVVPRSVVIEGDMRFLSRGQLDRARAKMRGIVAANLPKTSATITFEDGMPSMEPTDGNRALLATLDQVSRDIGTGPITAHDPSKRGAGDISFVAGLVSGLDGLGGLGEHDHAPGEYVDLDELTPLTKRAALLMDRVLWAQPPAATGARPPAAGQAQAPSAASGRPEATSLLGTPLYPVPLSPEARQAAEDNLRKAREAADRTPGSADALVWLGRQAAVAGHVREAIDVFTRGIARFPNDPRFYRHRGHRYISVREFDRAIADLTRATELIAGKPDEPEPTTADPAVMSSETLHYAIYYHLGLAYYLKGDFARALPVYRQCLAVAKGNDDQTVGASDWLYMTLRRLGRTDEAARVLVPIVPGMKVKDDRQYYDRLLMYKGLRTPEDLLTAGGDPVTAATLEYGVANWYLYNGRTAEATALFRRIITGPNWMPFGFIAAEAELARLK